MLTVCGEGSGRGWGATVWGADQHGAGDEDSVGMASGLRHLLGCGWHPTQRQRPGLVVTCTISLRIVRVRLGHHSQSPVYKSGQQLFQGIKTIPHPGYSHPRHANDLMLIKLNRRIRETQDVKPINISSQCPPAGTSCLVSGWGTTSSPQGERPGPSQCPPTSPFSPALSLPLPLSTPPLPVFLCLSPCTSV